MTTQDREAVWAQIQAHIDEHPYMSGVDRSKSRTQRTGEFFTPSSVVILMLRLNAEQADGEIGMGPGKTVLDPTCGDGQFLVGAKWVKVLFHGMTEEAACDDLFGVDLMPDNVRICLQRLGGGHIMVGNSLDPRERVSGQSDLDHFSMIALFDSRGLTAADLDEMQAIALQDAA